METRIKDQKRTPKPKKRTNSTKEFSEQFEGATGHYTVKQGFGGESHQKVHLKVRQNLCRKSSLGYLFCPQNESFRGGEAHVQLRPLASQKLHLCGHLRSQRILEQLLRSLFSEPADPLRSCSRSTRSTAGNSMTGSERPSPEPLLKKEASPAVLGGEAFKCLEL